MTRPSNSRRIYARPITNTLRVIIKEQVLALTDDNLLGVRRPFSPMSMQAGSGSRERVDRIRLTFVDEIRQQIVAPLLALLDGLLSQQSMRSTIPCLRPRPSLSKSWPRASMRSCRRCSAAPSPPAKMVS